MRAFHPSRLRGQVALVVLICLLAVAALGCLAPEVEAQDPFANSRTAPAPTSPPPIVRPSITPSAGSATGNTTAPAPSSPSSTEIPPLVDMQLPPPPTVLGQRPGTGSPSPTGVATTTAPGQKIAPEVLALLAKILADQTGGSPGSPAVTIGLTPPPEISQSLSATLSAHKLLAFILAGVASIFGAAKVGPLVAQAADGLRSAIAARSAMPQRLAALEALLLQASPSATASPAAPSSTPNPPS